MKRETLVIEFLDDLPKPPEKVKAQLDNWKAWQQFLPKGGPRRRTSCGSIEHMYVYYSRSRGFNQWGHAMEPNPRDMYDEKMGEFMDDCIQSLPELRRYLVLAVEWWNVPILDILRKRKLTEAKFQKELYSAYNQLAGKLCPSK